MKNLTVLIVLMLFLSCAPKKNADKSSADGVQTTITKTELQDKIKGGWAGQVIGCTYGGPTEFRYKGIMIDDSVQIPWDENRCLWYYQNSPGLYDDVYMDLTFVDVFEKEGLDAPASSHALAFANAGYSLWHANQAARYNILNGIMPPESGHWLYNPHSDDIDFQIEADFAGLMAPGLVNAATAICDKVGHIMNYGDGWYGGVYMASMYSLAFVSDDVDFVVNEALKTIPQESQFYRCIADVIKWHNENPDDWKATWNLVEKNWSNDIGCPGGVFNDFNIDAKINAAYVVMGLLYGEGDYSTTLEISTRCGQDSDCNPASAGGILGTMLGYSNIPEEWKKGVYPVEEMDFKYTTMSLADVYELGSKHALQVLEENGIKTEDEILIIPNPEIKPVALEVGFEGHFPKEKKAIGETLSPDKKEITFSFTGNGFVLQGSAKKTENGNSDSVAELEMRINDDQPETIYMPTNFATRKHEIAWRYQLPEAKHSVTVKLLNADPGFKVDVSNLLVYKMAN